MTRFWHVMGDEGFRLFFPLAALYAALWPVMWVLALGFDLPLARDVPPSLWHAHEMLFGAWGAALIGFLTTAVPEWTDTDRLRGRALFVLAGLWGAGRFVGLWGWDGAGAIGALADLGWMAALLVYLAHVSWRARSDALLGFGLWLGLLAGLLGAARWAMVGGDIAAAERALHLSGLAFLGLLGLALARITVPVTNLILDPSEKTSPFRPHPGRMNLPSGLVFVAIAGDLAALSPAVSGFLYCAAGAGFLDRLGEHFIGKSALRTEILLLAGASLGAGIGLGLIGTSRLGAPFGEVPGLHLALMGGLGAGVLAVLCIAGRLHADLPLRVPFLARIGGVCLLLATLARIAPGLGWDLPLPYMWAALLWAGAFGFWLAGYWRALLHMPEGQ